MLQHRTYALQSKGLSRPRNATPFYLEWRHDSPPLARCPVVQGLEQESHADACHEEAIQHTIHSRPVPHLGVGAIGTGI